MLVKKYFGEVNMNFFYKLVKHKSILANGEVNFLFPYFFLLKMLIEKFLKTSLCI